MVIKGSKDSIEDIICLGCTLSSRFDFDLRTETRRIMYLDVLEL
jgi:hypothetical protein